HAAVDGGLQEYFLDLVLRQAIVDGAAHVQLQLVRAVQGSDHRQVQQRSVAAAQPRTVPHVAPAVLRDQLLHVDVEVGGVIDRGVDVFGTQHGAARGQPLVEEFLVLGCVRSGHGFEKVKGENGGISA